MSAEDSWNRTNCILSWRVCILVLYYGKITRRWIHSHPRGVVKFSQPHTQNKMSKDMIWSKLRSVKYKYGIFIRYRFLFILSNFLLNKSASTRQKYEAKFLCPDRKGIVSYFFNTTKTHETVHACCNSDWSATLYKKNYIDLARAKSETLDTLCSLLKQNVKSCDAKRW